MSADRAPSADEFASGVAMALRTIEQTGSADRHYDRIQHTLRAMLEERDKLIGDARAEEARRDFEGELSFAVHRRAVLEQENGRLKRLLDEKDHEVATLKSEVEEARREERKKIAKALRRPLPEIPYGSYISDGIIDASRAQQAEEYDLLCALADKIQRGEL